MFSSKEKEILKNHGFKFEDNQYFYQKDNLNMTIDFLPKELILTIENQFHPLVLNYSDSSSLMKDVQGFIFSNYSHNSNNLLQ